MDSTQPGLPSTGAGNVSPTGSGSGPTMNLKMRKRTKTGCLTCRKRRIKCGEERPTCANCIKSKRQCEGYNQRVVFKPPIGDWPNHPGVVSTLQYHSSTLPGTRSGYRPPQHTTQPQDSSLASISPRPVTQFDFTNVETGPSAQSVLVGDPSPYAQDPNYPQPLQSPHHQQPFHSPHQQVPIPTSAASYFPSQASPAHSNIQGHYGNEGNIGYQSQQQYPHGGHSQQTPASYDTQFDQKPTVSEHFHASVSQAHRDQYQYQRHQPATSITEGQNPYVLTSNAPHAEGMPRYMETETPLKHAGSNLGAPFLYSKPSPVNQSEAGPSAFPAAEAHPVSSRSRYEPQMHNVDSDVKYVAQHTVLEQPVAVSQAQQFFEEPQLLTSGFGGEDHVSPTEVLDQAAVENEDNDYYDVQSDEEMIDREDGRYEERTIFNQDFSLMRQLHQSNTSELAIRRYDTFIFDFSIDLYRAETVANPLRNEQTARVFAHFIHATGPSLSIYERNPRNPTSIFEGPKPPSQQSLWTYILPLKALNNQGLLHAMLALSSLHIARLQGASPTPSYKHYAYALKRLQRSLGNTKTRLQIPTLATSLLLAFYEVTTAEHGKWSTHLAGACRLLAELDFPSLTQEARRLKVAQTAHEKQFLYQNPDMLIDQKQFEQKLQQSTMMPDEGLVSAIIGKRVSYDDFGRVFEEGARRNSMPKKLDLRSYETFQDLYWWYARHDAFQSIVSGNPLIMDYRKWSDCPPRAPLCRSDALYGSHDHLILLIGRIADFTVRDRERKLRQVDANGGQWRPTPGMPGMPMGPPPSHGQRHHQQQGAPPPPTAPMAPMGPPNAPPRMQGMGPPPGWTGHPPPGWPGGPPQMSPSGAPQMPPQMSPQSAGFMPPQGQPQRGPPLPSAMPTFYGMAPSMPNMPPPSSYTNPNTNPHNSPQIAHAPSPETTSDLAAAYDAALEDWTSISHAHATISNIMSNSPSFAPLTPDLSFGGNNTTPFGPALVHRSYDISILWALLHLSNILLLRSHPAMPPAAMVAASVCAPATAPYATLVGRIAAGLQTPSSKDAPLNPSLGAALIESTMSLFFAGITYQDPVQREWLITRLLDIDRRTGWASAGVIARSCETSWEKAAELGKGNPYPRRRTRRFGEEGPVVLDVDESGNNGSGTGGGWGGTSIIRDAGGGGRAAQGWMDMNEQPRRENYQGEEKRFVMKYRQALVPWAMNILATDEDLRLGMERVRLGGEINAAGTDRERVGFDVLDD
ncbi:hypothetical protein K469DRAFT_692810 [Zopfia rhizophila CBS 207.26]|uniref:Zn(2)-C6 fungal-type domain-containing protein n=1 Tax=Zopfia rhizophila CBS 207.26 TaxID=1314779 RepID=A0A6A6DRN5_9PEZI|nr:hypothetical protein K469DRAFT_692810 [Zopfia rhizophila CBS 207.26]